MPDATGRPLLNTALECLQLGWSLLPVGENKRPHGQALISTGHSRVNEEGRLIGVWAPLQTTRPSEDQVREWFSRPGRGLALVTGALSGVIGLDYDGEAGVATARSWGVNPHARTRSGGWHQYLTHPGWPVQTLQSHTVERLSLIRGVDIRGDGGYLTLPPTFFPPDRRYRQLRPWAPDPVSVIPEYWENGEVSGNPRALLGLHAPPAPPSPRAPRVARPLSGSDQDEMERDFLYRALEKVDTGAHRNETGAWLAQQLRDHGLSAPEVLEVMQRYAEQVPASDAQGRHRPYDFAEARGSVYQAFRRPAREAYWRPKREKDALDAAGSGPSELRAMAPSEDAKINAKNDAKRAKREQAREAAAKQTEGTTEQTAADLAARPPPTAPVTAPDPRPAVLPAVVPERAATPLPPATISPDDFWESLLEGAE